VTDGQTDDGRMTTHANSSIFAKIRSAKKKKGENKKERIVHFSEI